MKNRYTLALIALLAVQQSCQAAVKNLLLTTTTVVSTGIAAALSGKLGETAKVLSQGLFDKDVSLLDTLWALKPTAPAPAAPIADQQTLQLVASLTEQLATLTQEIVSLRTSPQPTSREFSMPYLGTVLTLMNNHKVLSAFIGSVGLGAVVYTSHEGTRTIMRERFAALRTALDRLRDQFMARMNGIEQQMIASTDALGLGLNTVDSNAVIRLNQLAAHQQHGFNQLAAQLALVTNQPAAVIQPIPVFTAQPVYTTPAQTSTAAEPGPLMDAEQQGFFGRICSWFSK